MRIRQFSKEDMNKLTESIKGCGYMKPIVMRQNGDVLVGQKILMIARKMGLKKLKAIVLSKEDDKLLPKVISDYT